MRGPGTIALPVGWAMSTLGEVCEKPEYGWTTSASTTGSLKLLRTTDITKDSLDWTQVPFCEENPSDLVKFKLRRGDIVISRAGSVGASALIDECPDAVFASYLIRFRPVNGMNERYVSYFLQSPDYWQQISQSAAGIALQNVNAKKLAAISFAIAPLLEQHRIVDVIEEHFTRLDAAVAALKRVQANLKRYRAAVLKAACEGRLVPTEAELARHEDRSYEPAPVLLEKILTERRSGVQANQSLAPGGARNGLDAASRKARNEESAGPDQTRLSQLPEGWVWTSLGQLFGVYIGATPSRAKPDFWGGEIAWVSSGEVRFCRIRETREKITSLGLAHTSTLIQPPGTVLLGMIGEGKTRGQVAILEIEACNNQNSAAIRVPDTPIPPEYVYRFLEGEYDRTRRRSSGGNQPALNKERVKAIPFPLPPLAEIQRIVPELERCSSLIDQFEKQVELNLEKAERLRQAVLKRAFDGRLVPQDPADQPASVLLDRIRANRTAAESALTAPRRQRRKEATHVA